MENSTEAVQVVADAPANEQPVKTEDIEALKAELAKTQVEAAKWKGEHDKQQKAAMELGKKAKDIQAIQSEIASMRESQELRFNVIAEAFDEQAKLHENYEEPKQEKTSYKQRLESIKPKLPDPKIVAQVEHKKDVAIEIVNLLKPLGLEMDKSKETRQALILFEQGYPDLALEEVKEIASKMSTKPDDREKEIAELKEKLAKYEKKEDLKQKGELKSEKGASAGSVLSFKDIEEKFTKNEISLEEYAEARKKHL